MSRPAETFSPSTNLAEISDWLTKLLLGAGLVSLSHLGGPIGDLINDVAGALHSSTAGPNAIQSAKVIAGAVMIGFTVLGILGGYITQLGFMNRMNSENIAIFLVWVARFSRLCL